MNVEQVKLVRLILTIKTLNKR